MSAPEVSERDEARRGPFARLYGRGPFHLVGHVVVIAITAYVLSIMFQARFAPEPINLILWLLGGAILHDAVFLPVYAAIAAGFAKAIGADDGRPVKGLLMGSQATDRNASRVEPPTRDSARAVPILNHVRVPIVLSAILFLTFLPRILDRQPQNFVNALGHAPPDFLGRWLFVTAVLAGGSLLLYAARRVRAGRAASA